MTAAEFKANVQAIRGLLDAPAQAPAPEKYSGTPQCPEHGAMKQGKRGGWYCPAPDERWHLL